MFRFSLIALLAMSFHIRAEEPATPDVKELQKQVEALKRRVDELEKQLAQVKAAAAQPKPATTSPGSPFAMPSSMFFPPGHPHTTTYGPFGPYPHFMSHTFGPAPEPTAFRGKFAKKEPSPFTWTGGPTSPYMYPAIQSFGQFFDFGKRLAAERRLRFAITIAEAARASRLGDTATVRKLLDTIPEDERSEFWQSFRDALTKPPPERLPRPRELRE